MLLSSQVMMWVNQEHKLIKSICLMRRGWPSARQIPTKESRTNTLHMLQCTGLETVGCRKPWTAFMRVGACYGVLPGVKAEACLPVVHKGAGSICCCGLFIGITLKSKVQY